MTPPTTENPSSQWDAILEYSKGIVTLAAALLGLTVTFADKVLTDSGGDGAASLLIGSWVVLAVTILCGVLTSAFVINYLRHGKKDKAAILFVNLSFFGLLVASVLFVLVGYRRTNLTPGPDLQHAVIGAKALVATSTSTRPSDWVGSSVAWNGTTHVIIVDVQRSQGAAKYQAVLTSDGRAISLRSTSP